MGFARWLIIAYIRTILKELEVASTSGKAIVTKATTVILNMMYLRASFGIHMVIAETKKIVNSNIYKGFANLTIKDFAYRETNADSYTRELSLA